MPLIDITHKPFQVNPKKERGNPIVVKIEKTLTKSQLDMINRIYDEGIDATMLTGGKVAWTKSGALFGYGSSRPKKDVDRLWERIKECVGDGKECMMAVGALLRVKMAERPEKWFVVKQETGERDPLTGKEITVSEYWMGV